MKLGAIIASEVDLFFFFFNNSDPTLISKIDTDISIMKLQYLFNVFQDIF